MAYLFSPNLKGLDATVIGTSGISGLHMLQVLREAPKRWCKV